MGQPPSVRADGPAPETIGCTGGTAGTETSQYREDEESTERPAVVANDPGSCLNRAVGDDRAGLEDRVPPWQQGAQARPVLAETPGTACRRG